MNDAMNFPTQFPCRLDEFLLKNYDMGDYYPVANNHRVITGFIHHAELGGSDAIILKQYVVANGPRGIARYAGQGIFGDVEALANHLYKDNEKPTSDDQSLYNEVFIEAPDAFTIGHPHAVAAILSALEHEQFRIAISDIAFDQSILIIDVLHSIYRVLNNQ